MAMRRESNPVARLGDLLPGAAGSTAERLVAGLQLDSRRLQRGELFLALPGDVHDGRDYLSAAVAAGAAAIVAERGLNDLQRAAAADLPLVEVDNLAQQLGHIARRFYRDPAAAMHLVGVTGTNGKTTTSRLLMQLLRRDGRHCGVIGTLGASLDDQPRAALNTTPDAVSLQRQLAEWREAGVSQAVLEVSSHSLVQGRVNGLDFHTGIFTNLTHDHLDYHGTMEAYAAAKAQLFTWPGLQLAVVNADDPWQSRMRSDTGVERYGYGIDNPAADIIASDVNYHAGGLEASLVTPWGVGRLRSPMAGHFNLGNLLAVIGAACGAGMPLQAVLSRLPSLRAVPGRMEYVSNPLGLQLVVDYAHTPDALEQVLLALRRHTRGRLICVFGCGGDRDADKRPRMGAIAAACADMPIVTSDNPRGEDPAAIIGDILGGMGGAARVEIDRADAIRAAVEMAGPNDCVLIAGKGHEDYQQVGTERLPFSDVEQLRLAVQERQR